MNHAFAMCYVFEPVAAIPIYPVPTEQCTRWRDTLPLRWQKWVDAARFTGKPGSVLLLPDGDGSVEAVVLGVADEHDFMSVAALPAALPAGVYELSAELAWRAAPCLERAVLFFGLGHYQYTHYVERDAYLAQLRVPEAISASRLLPFLQAFYEARDLINTPAEALGPQELVAAVVALGKAFSAEVHVTAGDALLKAGYPMIHAVGRASPRPPALVDLRWGDKGRPLVTLVCKGVCFDSGGLDLKSASGMRLMKKDMGGAALGIALARLIMSQTLPVSLRLLVGAVDNVVSGSSYKPGDVLRTRSGVTVEIHNTDAEGRLVLADALIEAVEEKPDCLLDLATLTGAARVALGPDFPVLFSQNETMAQAILSAGVVTGDPLWRLPLHAPYRRYFKSEIADMANASDSAFAGAITAALFLQTFVPNEIAWAHVDTFAYVQDAQPGRPVGGEALALRALFHYLEKRFYT